VTDPDRSEAALRKERSEQILRAERVPILASLPTIETADECVRRPVEEIARRLMALMLVSAKGKGVPAETIDDLIVRYGMRGHFSPEEQAYIENPSASERDRIQFSWRCEAAWPLLWALGYVENLGRPSQTWDGDLAEEVVDSRSFQEVCDDALLRSMDTILDEADLIYRYHWAVRDAQIAGADAPAGLNAGVVVERHRALNWLIGYGDNAEWDDVTTDT
jgi:hypothetical protein